MAAFWEIHLSILYIMLKRAKEDTRLPVSCTYAVVKKVACIIMSLYTTTLTINAEWSAI